MYKSNSPDIIESHDPMVCYGGWCRNKKEAEIITEWCSRCVGNQHLWLAGFYWSGRKKILCQRMLQLSCVLVSCLVVLLHFCCCCRETTNHKERNRIWQPTRHCKSSQQHFEIPGPCYATNAGWPWYSAVDEVEEYLLRSTGEEEPENLKIPIWGKF